MAEMNKCFYEEQFVCSVCLDVLKDPVTIPCGHSYCMACINRVWASAGQNAEYHCPQCRETFSSRPALKKNTLVAELMDKLKTTSGQTNVNQNDLSCVRVQCDCCIENKNPAEKFCMQCLVSYCTLHLRPHYESPAFTNHTLVNASAHTQKNICIQHGQLLDIYCHTDQQCICYLCMLASHQEHKISSVKSERMNNQDALEKTKIACQEMIEQKEKCQQQLSSAINSIQHFTQAAEDESERIFTELISLMKRKCLEVRGMIKAREQTEIAKAKEVNMQLDHEISQLRTKMSQIIPLLDTNDVDFLQRYKSVLIMPTFDDVPVINNQPHESSGQISLSALKEQLEDVCQQEVARISREVMNIHIVQPEPKTREDFLRYFCDLHVDMNTVNQYICLSEDNRKLTGSKDAQPYPKHPERFNKYCNALCKEALFGRSYWEVACSGGQWCVAVAYKSIHREVSNESRFGFNKHSWRLSNSVNTLLAMPRENLLVFNVQSSLDCGTVGIYLDHSAGTLSFYNVADTMNLLCKFKTRFTEPLYAGFGVTNESSIKILQLIKEKA